MKLLPCSCSCPYKKETSEGEKGGSERRGEISPEMEILNFITLDLIFLFSCGELPYVIQDLIFFFLILLFYKEC